MSMKEDLNKLSETLRQRRDELRVRLHLAKEDVKDEWDDLEVYWEKFRQKMEEAKHEAEGVSKETRETASRVGEELKEGYERLRKRMK
ncbi:hypothetical protein [uncultured Marinobacter sp.]|uniref:hypothetical protein n=1 Tax=uncultured Marinobacter sp. TaxID=187379 RepID=UPI0030DA8C55|tara:strand:- start:443 stop:706 length:264 start_codon:yes stop_codon:yes gene_type:complete